MMPAPGITAPQQTSKATKVLTLLAAVGVAYFLLMLMLLHLLSPDYDFRTRFISEYGLGSYSFLLTTGFLSLGIGSVLLVLALFGIKNPGAFVWKAGLTLLAIWGLSVTLDGIFPLDQGVTPVTFAGEVHLMAAMIAFLSLLVASLLLSLALRKMPLFRWMAPIALILVASMFISFVVSVVLDTVLQGLTQRIFVLFCVAWLLFVAIGVHSSLKEE